MAWAAFSANEKPKVALIEKTMDSCVYVTVQKCFCLFLNTLSMAEAVIINFVQKEIVQ